MILKLPKVAEERIKLYKNLPLDGKKIRCPYYLNPKHIRMGLRVLVGKGTPKEIIKESLIYEKLRGIDFDDMSPDEIREFLVKRRIGIECSGFVTHILNSWLRSQNKKKLWKYLNFPKRSLYRVIARKLRPIENISAKLLTEDLNSNQVKDFNNIKPGDLIRNKGLKKGYHVVLITRVMIEKGRVKKFSFSQSNRWYEDAHGVRSGSVIITDSKGKLSEQKWVEEDGMDSWLLKGIEKDEKYAQIRRLKNVPL